MEVKRNFKIIKEHIDNIKEINEEKGLLLFDDNKIEYCFLREDNKYILKRYIRENDKFVEGIENSNLNNNILITKNEEKLIVKDSIFKSHNWIEEYITYSTSSFESINFRENNFFQLVIISEKKIRFDTIFANLISISTEINRNALNGITFKIKSITFYLYFVNDYCVIENLDKLNFESFDKYSRTALSCFGLLSGYVPRDEGFYFSYTDNKFENMEEYAYYGDFYCTYDMEIYKPIDTNFYYSFIQKGITDLEKNDFRKKAEDNLFLISESVFSKLCNLNVDSKEILRATELIMEGNQQTLPETKGVIYSVILEILTNYISKGKCKDLLTPINDKSKAKNLQKELHCVAKKYITFYENSPIQKKINSINSPTNMDKLLKPFEFLNILLTDTDKNIIKNRNYFLHGNDFIKGKDLPEFADNSLYINLKLLFLIYALLLKIIGHHGKIVNIVKKIYFKDKEIAKDEEFYRDIGNELSKNIFNY